MGSSIALLRELNELNARTWRADQAVLRAWYEAGSPTHGCRVEAGARFAMGLAVELAQKAADHRLPMLMDY